MFFGTTVEGTVVRVVDGDTVRIRADGREESIRNLALDTEESNSGSPTKPQTPWGRAAKAEAQRLLPNDAAVTLEFPGTEPRRMLGKASRQLRPGARLRARGRARFPGAHDPDGL
jgi:micrococcal nuclease